MKFVFHLFPPEFIRDAQGKGGGGGGPGNSYITLNAALFIIYFLLLFFIFFWGLLWDSRILNKNVKIGVQIYRKKRKTAVKYNKEKKNDYERICSRKPKMGTWTRISLLLKFWSRYTRALDIGLRRRLIKKNRASNCEKKKRKKIESTQPKIGECSGLVFFKTFLLNRSDNSLAEHEEFTPRAIASSIL